MSTFLAKDGTQIYFKDWGSGKPVLFSHGWPLDADMWEYQMEYLSSRGFRTIAFDRRGFGRSDQPWTGNDYNTFADDIAQLIEHLDLKDVTLVGFSMGGGDVARYIARHGSARVAGLVLLGAVTPIFGQTADYPQGVPAEVFDGIKAGLLKDRAQFISEFNTPFFGLNKGQVVSPGVLTQTLQIALQASLKSTVDCVTAFADTDFRPGHGQDRRTHPGDTWRWRPDRAIRNHRQSGRRTDQGRRAESLQGRAPRVCRHPHPGLE